MDGMVMRSVYLWALEDGQLRQLAHDLHVSKSDLIRSAISAKLKEWLENDNDESVLADLELGRRGMAGRNSPASGSPKAAAAKAGGHVRRPPRGGKDDDAPATDKGRATKSRQRDRAEAGMALVD